MPDEDGRFNAPIEVRSVVWHKLRPYAHIRLWLKDAPFIPGWAKPFLRGSAKIGAVVEWAIGPDPLGTTEDVV
jgi:hypothetical protein